MNRGVLHIGIGNKRKLSSDAAFDRIIDEICKKAEATVAKRPPKKKHKNKILELRRRKKEARADAAALVLSTIGRNEFTERPPKVRGASVNKYGEWTVNEIPVPPSLVPLDPNDDPSYVYSVVVPLLLGSDVRGLNRMCQEEVLRRCRRDELERRTKNKNKHL
jgi:hypothetical protein